MNEKAKYIVKIDDPSHVKDMSNKSRDWMKKHTNFTMINSRNCVGTTITMKMYF